MDWATIFGWISGIVSTLMILMLKAELGARRDERRTRRATSLDDRRRRIETDRGIYAHRLTILIRSNLATFIRSGKWWTDEEDLRRLLRSLEDGAYEDFLDPEVNDAWQALLARTLELAQQRLAGKLSSSDIQEYNALHRIWEDAAKRSFGPLPETPDLVPRLNARRGGAGTTRGTGTR